MIRYNVQQISEDMAIRGWSKLDLSKVAGVSDMTIIRFLRGDNQSAPTAKKIADALGHSVKRYLLSKTGTSVKRGL
jgi:transcriptional regulator with XRE-family HTH domain